VFIPIKIRLDILIIKNKNKTKELFKMEKTKLIFKKKLAEELIRMGNTFIKTIPNYKRKGFIVWIFKEDDKFKKDFDELSKEMKKKKEEMTK